MNSTAKFSSNLMFIHNKYANKMGKVQETPGTEKTLLLSPPKRQVTSYDIKPTEHLV